MPLIRDHEEERLARIDQLLQQLAEQRAELQVLTAASVAARAQRQADRDNASGEGRLGKPKGKRR